MDELGWRRRDPAVREPRQNSWRSALSTRTNLPGSTDERANRDVSAFPACFSTQRSTKPFEKECTAWKRQNENPSWRPSSTSRARDRKLKISDELDELDELDEPVDENETTAAAWNSQLQNENGESNSIVDPLNALEDETSDSSCTILPDDFHSIRAKLPYPTDTDFRHSFRPHLRQNKLKGAYDSVDEYVYVQFQLLREDFMRPLREQIEEFKRSKPYTYEVIIMKKTSREDRSNRDKTHGSIHSVNGRRLMKIRNSNSLLRDERYLPGSMILLTKNNFRTFTCATVRRANYPIEIMLTYASLMVRTENEDCTEDDFDLRELTFDYTSIVGSVWYKYDAYQILESSVYFRPYEIVMHALQNLDNKNFPMKKYIIDGDTRPRYPAYLRKFDTYDVFGHQVNPFKLESWPTASDLRLDEKQYHALTSALTREFSITQGPPGTGKTFLGLKIAEVLLTNARLQPQFLKLPIVVVCYTNHALDQFLEGILAKTQEVVRVGCRSLNHNVSTEYNLHDGNRSVRLKKVAAERIKNTAAVRLPRKKSLEKRKQCELELASLGNAVGILKVEKIRQFMNNCQKEILQSNEDISSWLLDLASENENFEENNIDAKAYLNEIESEIENSSSETENMFSITLSGLNLELRDKLTTYRNMQENGHGDGELRLELNENIPERTEAKQNVNDIKELRRKYELLKTKLKEGGMNDPDNEELKTLNLRKDLRDLPVNLRWKLYRNWLRQYTNEVAKEEIRTRTALDSDTYEELFVLECSEIVGITTTIAASFKYRELLQLLRPSVVIVEEAAQVNEAHVVTSLPKDCQHVILIGDHKQLKPSVATYELAKSYHMDVSLFERMIINDMDCPSLNMQHRMRPEISSLITPHIYPDLTNHESVLKYESIKGITKNLFFLDHNKLESECHITKSKQNIFEANFMVMLCRYLVWQGYSPNKITILTTYMDQQLCLRKLIQKNEIISATSVHISSVKCVVVDKYQGEENDIVLLSLVRSNNEGKIGFLNVSNRVCVALSRAKKGLYVIGNMGLLSRRSELWRQIKQTLETQNAIGDALVLRCQNHSRSARVSKAEDFVRVPLGGCTEICNEPMPCGHKCANACHAFDRKHERISKECKEPCIRNCPRSHPCKLICYEDCKNCDEPVEMTLPCDHKFTLPCRTDENEYVCPVTFDATLPTCGHLVQRLCQQKLEDVKCPMPCEETLKCGHLCPSTCHQDKYSVHTNTRCRRACEKLNEHCPKKHRCRKLCFEKCELSCSVEEPIHLDCGHEKVVPCFSSGFKTSLKCDQRCERICENCNLRCQKNCIDKCRPCVNRIQKIIPECQHQVTLPCWQKPTRELCEIACPLMAPCGHQCKLKCGQPCSTGKCLEMVKFYDVKPLCGHSYINVECYKTNDVSNLNMEDFLKRCDVPCDTVLECGHTCSGTCAECWEGRFHVACEKPCQRVLLCGHKCTASCRVICPPCEEKCTYRCKHSKCSSLCSVNCSPCQKPCEHRCTHSACTRVCGAYCDREPCHLPCEKLSEKCGHACMGFCGEPCPPVCRICDSEELKNHVFGWTDDENARCVVLEDCGHIIESKTMDSFVFSPPTDSDIKEIRMKGCPRCSEPITQTLRYPMKRMYTFLKDISTAVHMTEKTMIACRRELFEKLQKLSCESRTKLDQKLRWLIKIIDHYRDTVKLSKPKNDATSVSRQQLAAISYYEDVFAIVIALNDKLREFSGTRPYIRIIKRFLWFTDRIKTVLVEITRQQMLDLNRQLWQYEKMVLFCRLQPSIDSHPDFAESRDRLEEILFKWKKLSPDDERRAENLFQSFYQLDNTLRPPKSAVEFSYTLNCYYAETSCAGRWFTCSRGHYFSYLDATVSTIDSKCPKCYSA